MSDGYLIQLYEGADLSSLIHETGHFFQAGMAETLRRYPDGTLYVVEQVKRGSRLEFRTAWRALPGAQLRTLMVWPESDDKDKDREDEDQE